MEVNKYRLAMRPKKYLTHDFIVYQDPSMQAARSEMQAGGVVQREGFSVGQGARTDLGEKGVKELPSNMKRIFDIVYPEKNWEDLSYKQRGNFIYDFPRREKILNSIPKNYITLDELAEKLNIKRTSINEPRTTLGKFINENLQPQTFGNIAGKGGGSTKYYKDPGVRLTKKILRIAGQDVRIDNLRKNTVKNINKLYTTYYDDFYKKGLVPDIEDIKIMSASEAGNATTRLAQILDGKKFKNKGLEKIRVNKKVANQLFEELSKFQFGNPYQSQLYKISLETIDQKLGNKKGTFNDLKNKAKNILKENKIPIYDSKSKNPYGFNINEIAGVAGSAKSKAPEFSQFIDIMEGELNQKDLAAFQSVLSRARGDIELNPNALQKQMRKVNSYASNLEKKFDVQLPRIRKAEDITKYYTPKRLEELKKQGLDIAGASKRAGYTIQMPKGAITIQEFTNNPEKMRAVIRSFSPDPKCQIPGKAEGGRVSFQAGSDICYQQGLKEIEKAKTNPTVKSRLASKIGNVTKTVGKGLRFLELPLEAAIEGLLVGDAMLRGQSFERAVKGRTLLLRAFTPGGYSSSFDEQTLKEIGEFSPAAKSYYDSKTRSDKYKELQTKLENAKKLKDSEVALVDQDYVNSTINSAQKEFDDFVRDNASYFRLDEEILKPGGYYAQQADEAANKFFFDEARESVYGKMREGIETTGKDTMVPGLDTYTLPTDIERAKTKVQPFENVEALNLPPTAMEFEQSITPDEKTAMKNFIKQRRPGISDEEAELLTTIAMSEQYKNISTPFPGIDRLGFAGGGLTRRGFLKLMAGIAATVGAVKSGIVKLTTPAAKRVLKDAPTGTPDWFAPLVDKIMKEGVDGGETMKTTTSREIVKKLEVKSPDSDGALTDKYFLYENPDTGEIRIEIDAPGLGTYDGEFSLYMRPDRVDGIADDGTPILSDGEFFVTEDRVVGRASSPDDYDIDLEPLDTDLEGSASNWHKVEEFATGKTDKKAQAKQLEKKERIEAFPHEDLTDRYGDYDPPDPDDY